MSWEIIGFFFLVLFAVMVGGAINLNSETNEVCKNYDEVDSSIWDDYYTCFNHSVINGSYTITVRQDFIKGGLEN